MELTKLIEEIFKNKMRPLIIRDEKDNISSVVFVRNDNVTYYGRKAERVDALNNTFELIASCDGCEVEDGARAMYDILAGKNKTNGQWY